MCLCLIFGGLMVAAQPDPPTFLCVTKQDGELTFNWENNHNCSVGDFVETRIYESTIDVGPWTLIHTTGDPNEVTATVPNSNQNVIKYHYMEVECTAGISAPSAILDEILPVSPNITRVSVIAGETEISWDPSPSPEAYAYLIYRENDQGLFELIDTVFIADIENPAAPSTTDIFSKPDQESEEFSITTMDFCGNSGAAQNNTPHSTVYLTADYDSCAMVVNLSWTPYQGWDSIFSHTIYTGPPGFLQELTSLPKDQFSYSYEIQPTDPLPFVVQVSANLDNITSSNSNSVQLDTELEALPLFVFARNVSVIDENQVRLEWDIDTDGIGGDLFISRGREKDDMGIISEIGPLSDPLPNVEVDNAAETLRGAYYYAIVALNDCGTSVSSDTIRTIFLDGQDNFDLTTGLFWNELEIPQANINEYILHRVEGGMLVPIESFLPGESLTYIDDVSGLNPVDGQYCYKVEAKFTIQPIDEFEDEGISLSNTFCLSQTSRIFVPSTFSPNGVNNLFQPIILFPNPDDYAMKVFNRWGEIVYETNDPEAGWDGTVDDQLVQQGVYAYYITMKSTNGNNLERKGTVLLLR